MKVFTCYYDSPLGFLKVQSGSEKLVSIGFSEDNGHNDVHPLLKTCMQQLNDYFSGERLSFDLPLELAGTEFQKKVWKHLLTIPYGRTISYQRFSESFGNVKAIRAVASANGRNNFAIVIPCHRVVGSNESLVGYAGGLWRKKWLLQHEQKIVSGVEQASLFAASTPVHNGKP